MKRGDKVRNRITGQLGIVSTVDGNNLYLVGHSPNVAHLNDWHTTDQNVDDDKAKSGEHWP